MRRWPSFIRFLDRNLEAALVVVVLLCTTLVYAQETGEAERKAKQEDLLNKLRAKKITEDELPILARIGDAEAIPVLEEAFWTWWPNEAKLRPYYGTHNPYGHLDYILEIIRKIGGREAEESLERILARLKETGRSGRVEFEKSDLERLKKANKVIELMRNPKSLEEAIKAGGEEAYAIYGQRPTPLNEATRRAILYADLSQIEDDTVRNKLINIKIDLLPRTTCLWNQNRNAPDWRPEIYWRNRAILEELAKSESDPRLILALTEMIKQYELVDVRTQQELFLNCQRVLADIIQGKEVSSEVMKFALNGVVANYEVDPVSAYTTLNTLLDERGDLMDWDCLYSILTSDHVWWIKKIDPTLKLRNAFLEKLKKQKAALKEREEAARQAERERNAAYWEERARKQNSTAESEDDIADEPGMTSVPTHEISLPGQDAKEPAGSSTGKPMPGDAESNSSIAWFVLPLTGVALLTVVLLSVRALKRR